MLCVALGFAEVGRIYGFTPTTSPTLPRASLPARAIAQGCYKHSDCTDEEYCSQGVYDDTAYQYCEDASACAQYNDSIDGSCPGGGGGGGATTPGLEPDPGVVASVASPT